VEVLSSSAAGGAKFASYRKIESLREYVLVDCERRSVEVFRKDIDEHCGHWVLYPFVNDEIVELRSIAMTISMASVYEDTELAA
jgi:Uma2 family endonuclease